MAAIYKRGKVWWARAQRAGKEYRQSLATGDRPTAQKRMEVWLKELEATSVTTTEKHYAFLDEEAVAQSVSRTKPGTRSGGLKTKA